jgi:adenosylmethionine-8-amino-7-oxononanoate aminotransferase
MDATRTARLREQDIHHLIHPLTNWREHQSAGPVIFAEGRGATLIDNEGRTYIDGSACLWNVNIGHGRAELAEIAAEQMKRLGYSPLFTSASHEPAIALAAKLAEMTPGDLGAALFASGGSEANDTTFKLVRYYWRLKGQPERVKIISRHGGYHGLTIATTAATGIPAYWEQFQPLAPGFLHVSPPNTYATGTTPDECTRRCTDELEATIAREGPDTIAAFIAEPVQGTGGVIVPPDDYLPRMYEVCHRHGVLCIADEVITGFGRLGTTFGVEQWHVLPDIMVVAKGITSGYFPLAAAILRQPLFDELIGLAPDGPFMHGFTYSGHPVGCAVALGNIAILERERLAENAARIGRVLLDALHESLDDHPLVGDVRGRGLMAGVELVKHRGSRTKFPGHQAIGRRVVREAVRRGVLFRPLPGDVIAMSPPLVVTEPQVVQMVETLRGALDATLDALAREAGAARIG